MTEQERILREIDRLKTIKNISLVALASGAVISSIATLTKVAVEWRGTILLKRAKEIAKT